jgi:hypothetical protein
MARAQLPNEIAETARTLRRHLLLIFPIFGLWMAGVALGDYTHGAVHYLGNVMAIVFGLLTLRFLYLAYRYWQFTHAIRSFRDD